MKGLKNDGSLLATTAKTPASVKKAKSPPRCNAPGIFGLPSPPKQIWSPPGRPNAVVASVQPLVFRSAQSATHSSTLPTMSNTPHADLQLDRDPAADG